MQISKVLRGKIVILILVLFVVLFLSLYMNFKLKEGLNATATSKPRTVLSGPNNKCGSPGTNAFKLPSTPSDQCFKNWYNKAILTKSDSRYNIACEKDQVVDIGKLGNKQDQNNFCKNFQDGSTQCNAKVLNGTGGTTVCSSS